MHVVVRAAPAAGQEHQICENQHYKILAQNLDIILMFPVDVYEQNSDSRAISNWPILHDNIPFRNQVQQNKGWDSDFKMISL